MPTDCAAPTRSTAGPSLTWTIGRGDSDVALSTWKHYRERCFHIGRTTARCRHSPT